MGTALRSSFPSLLAVRDLGPACPAAPAERADAPRALVGSWLGWLGSRFVTLDLRADGTFSFGELSGGWSASRFELVLADQPLRYRVDGAGLVLADGAGQALRWVRME